MKKNSKRNYNGTNGILWLFLLPLVQLVLILFVKYRNQNLPISEFKPFFIGNLLNILPVILIILFLLIINKRDKKILLEKKQLFFVFSIASILFLLFAFSIQHIPLGIKKQYVLDQPIEKVITGILYLTHLQLLSIWLCYLWLLFFKSVKYIFVTSIINSILIIILLFLFTMLYQKDYVLKNVNGKNSNEKIAVVLGAAVWSIDKPSTTLKARLEKAVELYNSKKITKIQVTGSNAPGELPEAEVGYNFLISNGIPSEDIYKETKTTSTTEQIKFVKNELFEKKGITNIILVSDKYHLKRSREISTFFNLPVEVVSSELKISEKDALYNKLRETIALLFFWLFAI